MYTIRYQTAMSVALVNCCFILLREHEAPSRYLHDCIAGFRSANTVLLQKFVSRKLCQHQVLAGQIPVTCRGLGWALISAPTLT